MVDEIIGTEDGWVTAGDEEVAGFLFLGVEDFVNTLLINLRHLSDFIMHSSPKHLLRLPLSLKLTTIRMLCARALSNIKSNRR